MENQPPLNCFQVKIRNYKSFETLGYSKKRFKGCTWVSVSQIAKDKNGKCLSWKCFPDSFIISIFTMNSGTTAGPWTCGDAGRLHNQTRHTREKKGWMFSYLHIPQRWQPSEKVPTFTNEEQEALLGRYLIPLQAHPALGDAVCPPWVKGTAGASGCIHLSFSQHAECLHGGSSFVLLALESPYTSL